MLTYCWWIDVFFSSSIHLIPVARTEMLLILLVIQTQTARPEAQRCSLFEQGSRLTILRISAWLLHFKGYLLSSHNGDYLERWAECGRAQWSREGEAWVEQSGMILSLMFIVASCWLWLHRTLDHRSLIYVFTRRFDLCSCGISSSAFKECHLLFCLQVTCVCRRWWGWCVRSGGPSCLPQMNGKPVHPHSHISFHYIQRVCFTLTPTKKGLVQHTLQ